MTTAADTLGTAPAPEISVVVPVFNERDNLELLHRSLRWALDGLGRSYEMLIVDDGSTDGTRALLKAFSARDPRLRAILLRRNYGQTAAMAAGFTHARGSILVTMDGDLQNDPSDIGRLLARLEEGWDVVCGWRRNRQDRVATRLLPSRLANALIRRITGVRIHDTGCSLKAYRGWVVRNLDLYSDMHRFLAALGAGMGARITELPVRHHARRHGRSKYGLGRIFRVLTDLLVIKMLVQFSAHPIRWFGLLALLLFAVGAAVYAFGLLDTGGGWTLADEPDLSFQAAGMAAILVAFNLFFLGFLAELQVKVSGLFKRRRVRTAREATL